MVSIAQRLQAQLQYVCTAMMYGRFAIRTWFRISCIRGRSKKLGSGDRRFISRTIDAGVLDGSAFIFIVERPRSMPFALILRRQSCGRSSPPSRACRYHGHFPSLCRHQVWCKRRAVISAMSFYLLSAIWTARHYLLGCCAPRSCSVC